MLVPSSHPFTQTLALTQSFVSPIRLCLYQSDCWSGTKTCHLIVTPFAPWLVTAVMAVGLVCCIAWGFISWKQEFWSQENFQITPFTYSRRDENLAGFSASPVFLFPLRHSFTLSCCKIHKALNSSSQPQIDPPSSLLSLLKYWESPDFFHPRATICDF